MSMDGWIGVGVNGLFIGVAVSVVGFVIRRWTRHVDEKLDALAQRFHELDLRLAENFVAKPEFETEKGRNKESHGNLWSEYRRMDRDYGDRLTVIETTLKMKKPRGRRESGS